MELESGVTCLAFFLRLCMCELQIHLDIFLATDLLLHDMYCHLSAPSQVL